MNCVTIMKSSAKMIVRIILCACQRRRIEGTRLIPALACSFTRDFTNSPSTDSAALEILMRSQDTSQAKTRLMDCSCIGIFADTLVVPCPTFLLSSLMKFLRMNSWPAMSPKTSQVRSGQMIDARVGGMRVQP